MSYQVLARKYRPQRFADVAGQEHVTVTLMNALTQGRVAHGYIFSGHRGIGKTTVARILAMALNCRNPIGSELRPTAEPCEVCESCIEVRAGNSVDVIEIDAATNRGIDEIRELRDAARYRPARDRFKIYILDEAHQITDAAFNALLKTLEEPPDHIVFMMATTQPEDIPQTVRSRCQHFSFRAVKLEAILGELRAIAQRENLDADDSALNLIAEAGDGSMRDALSVMDQAIAGAPAVQGRPGLHAEQIRELLGAVSNVIFERMLESVDAGRAADLITKANEQMDTGNSPAQLARQMVRYLRSVLLAKIMNLPPETGDGAGADLLQVSIDERRRAARSAALFTEEELTRFLQIMLRAFDELGYRQEQRLHFELSLMKLVHLRRLLPIEELLSQLPTTSSGNAARVPPPTSPLRAASLTAGTGSAQGATRPTVSSPAATRSALQAGGPGEEAVVTGPPVPVASSSPADPEGASLPQQVGREQDVPEVEALRAAALEALSGTKGQSSAGDALAEAEWTVHDGMVRAQTQLSKTMLGVVINADAMQVIRGALAARGAYRFEALSVVPGQASVGAKPSRPARSGTAAARAEQHPIVKEAQRLFNAEIRNVIDLSNK